MVSSLPLCYFTLIFKQIFVNFDPSKKNTQRRLCNGVFFLSSAKSRGRVFLPVGWTSHCHTSPFSEFTLTIDYTNLTSVWLCLMVPNHSWTMNWIYSSTQLMKIGIFIMHKYTLHIPLFSTRKKKFPATVQREVSCSLCCNCPPTHS